MSSFRKISGEYTNDPYVRDIERILSIVRRGHMMDEKKRTKKRKEKRCRELKKTMNNRFEREAFLSECAISSRAYYKKLERQVG